MQGSESNSVRRLSPAFHRPRPCPTVLEVTTDDASPLPWQPAKLAAGACVVRLQTMTSRRLGSAPYWLTAGLLGAASLLLVYRLCAFHAVKTVCAFFGQARSPTFALQSHLLESSHLINGATIC
ncbi:unnamed protein product [Acanthoscelides obtectus]|uniref:Uncharacterized protein n=1 Tax=Acanthoscelides obtectus TaxID=200917 RepID=A0A9P0Q466_ACAOB|nr:unnamed protein product [Acanthoscelides obtectus]CAK1663158.1 hypothetical protein AOBTE_LOCUS23520 [Acanthoscelides obtectus]